eukprot:s2510_g7.t2
MKGGRVVVKLVVRQRPPAFSQHVQAEGCWRLVPVAATMACTWRRVVRRGRRVRRWASAPAPPVAGKYDGEALDQYFGKDPLRAVSRLVEVASRINAARAAWQDEGRPVEWRGERVRSEVACLGTVFVKLAQTMATRSDLVSRELGRELGILQDSMGRFPDDVALQTIREERILLYVLEGYFTNKTCFCIVISTGAFFGLPYLANRFGITAEGEFVFWTDTVGLAAFAVLGARVAACLPDHHVHAGACALCGLSTACFGGLVRDILCQKPPRILYAEHEMYATPALLGALVCERPLDVEGMLLGAWVVIELRVLALNHGLRLPAFPSEEFNWDGPVAGSRSLEGAETDPADETALFASLTPEPVAAASLAQVYRGKLVDGQEVAVKVQRPGLAEQVGLDFYVLRQILAMVNAVIGVTRSSEIAQSVLAEVADGLFAELDFTMEAEHIEKFRDLYGEACPDVVVPEVIWSRTKVKVLTTSWLHGRKPRELTASEKLRMVNLAAPCLSLQLMDAGFVHCDPHEGNMMLLEDGRLGLIDFGLVAQMTNIHQESMASAILSLLAEDYRALVPCFRGMGILNSDRDDVALMRPGETQPFAEALEEALTGGGGKERLVQDSMGLDRRRAFGQLYEELSGLAFRYYFTLPSYYILVMRSFVTLEGIAFAADPDFNMYTTSSPYAFRRLLTPRTDDGKKLLKQTVLEDVSSRQRLRLFSLLQGSLISGKRQSKDLTRTATKTVMDVLLAGEGRELRRILASLDSILLVEDLTSPSAAPLRRAALEAAMSPIHRSTPRRRRMRSLLRQLMWRHVRRAARKRPFLVAKLGLQVVVGTLFSRFVQKPDEKVKVH